MLGLGLGFKSVGLANVCVTRSIENCHLLLLTCAKITKMLQ